MLLSPRPESRFLFLVFVSLRFPPFKSRKTNNQKKKKKKKKNKKNRGRIRRTEEVRAPLTRHAVGTLVAMRMVVQTCCLLTGSMTLESNLTSVGIFLD